MINNLGGIQRIFFAEWKNPEIDFQSGGIINSITTIEWNSLPITKNSFNVSEKTIRNKEGLLFNVEINGLMPKDSALNSYLLDTYSHKKLLILTYDNNKKLRLFGDADSGLTMTFENTTGIKVPDLNTTKLNFAGNFRKKCFFLADSEIIENDNEITFVNNQSDYYVAITQGYTGTHIQFVQQLLDYNTEILTLKNNSLAYSIAL